MQSSITVAELQARINVLVEVSKIKTLPVRFSVKVAKHYRTLVNHLEPFGAVAQDKIAQATEEIKDLTNEEEKKVIQARLNSELAEINNTIVELEDIHFTEKELPDSIPPAFVFVFSNCIK